VTRAFSLVHDRLLAENKLSRDVLFSGMLKFLCDPVNNRGMDEPRVAFEMLFEPLVTSLVVHPGSSPVVHWVPVKPLTHIQLQTSLLIKLTPPFEHGRYAEQSLKVACDAASRCAWCCRGMTIRKTGTRTAAAISTRRAKHIIMKTQIDIPQQRRPGFFRPLFADL
jgi:hypothetical protein